jgi:hypothetical protein
MAFLSSNAYVNSRRFPLGLRLYSVLTIAREPVRDPHGLGVRTRVARSLFQADLPFGAVLSPTGRPGEGMLLFRLGRAGAATALARNGSLSDGRRSVDVD